MIRALVSIPLLFFSSCGNLVQSWRPNFISADLFYQSLGFPPLPLITSSNPPDLLSSLQTPVHAKIRTELSCTQDQETSVWSYPFQKNMLNIFSIFVQGMLDRITLNLAQFFVYWKSIS
uniref:Lipoprotein n=1 Tax=Aegilops tauschii subsp. strangulata TaxID=200361 RepID=A0A452YZA6_AEGTS